MPDKLGIGFGSQVSEGIAETGVAFLGGPDAFVIAQVTDPPMALLQKVTDRAAGTCAIVHESTQTFYTPAVGGTKVPCMKGVYYQGYGDISAVNGNTMNYQTNKVTAC